jgi:hypothetical protein
MVKLLNARFTLSEKKLPTAWIATDQRDIEDAIEIWLPERIIVLRDADDRCLRAKRRNVLEAPLPVAWAMPRRRHTRPPGPPPCSTSAPPGRTTGAGTRWSKGGCKSEERSGLCAALESHRAASPEPRTMPDDAPSRTPPTAKRAPRAEPPRLARATSHPEPRPLTGLPELETLAGEHRHHQLSYCVVGAALRSSIS